jgi:PadR family transcriptional regulator, regulatory protein PadR
MDDLTREIREILLALWKVHILHHAAERPVYGQWIIGELRRHGYDISPGTVYPLLRRMERLGWLECADTGARRSPKARREYALTRKGAGILGVLRASVGELYGELAGETPRFPGSDPEVRAEVLEAGVVGDDYGGFAGEAVAQES